MTPQTPQLPFLAVQLVLSPTTNPPTARAVAVLCHHVKRHRLKSNRRRSVYTHTLKFDDAFGWDQKLPLNVSCTSRAPPFRDPTARIIP